MGRCRGSECCKLLLHLLLAFSGVCFKRRLIHCLHMHLSRPFMNYDVDFPGHPQSRILNTELTCAFSPNVQYHLEATCRLECHLSSSTILSDPGIIALQEVNRMLVILDISDAPYRFVIS